MQAQDKNDTANLPKLGRVLNKIDSYNGVRYIFIFLITACGVLFLIDFFIEKHGYFTVENLYGFYGFYGFVMFSGIIFSVKILRTIIKRPENYYGTKAIDQEVYPEDELEKVDHGS
ncbi:MAG: putative membrane protein [Paracoccaceae bacterium]|jgi:uncharacterized membrane protein